MQEDYLHYVWEFQKWNKQVLKTTEGSALKVLTTGSHNFHSGPDFFNARLVLGEQEWAGNVEIHIKSSDWYAHKHEQDPAYDNVILHVVWEHDLDIYRKDNSPLPVLELKDIIIENALRSYEQLSQKSSGKWINCEDEFALNDTFTLDNWLERLFFERLEVKSNVVLNLLSSSAGDWEEVLFKMLAKNFGLNINGDAFLSVANSIPFVVVRKLRGNLEELEAVFLGQAGLLEQELEEVYYKKLQERYHFLRRKFKLSREGIIPVKYFRLRPDNFPQLRLAQLASVYHHQPALFSKLIATRNPANLEELLSGNVSDFWNTHYTFSKSHKPRSKRLTPEFVNLVMINSLVPVKFSYLKQQGEQDFEVLIHMLSAIPEEQNQVVEKFNQLRSGTAKSAVGSQALLQLKKEYCDKNRCLHCTLGLKILQRQEQN